MKLLLRIPCAWVVTISCKLILPGLIKSYARPLDCSSTPLIIHKKSLSFNCWLNVDKIPVLFCVWLPWRMPRLQVAY